jgi:hypothetical protein
MANKMAQGPDKIQGLVVQLCNTSLAEQEHTPSSQLAQNSRKLNTYLS